MTLTISKALFKLLFIIVITLPQVLYAQDPGGGPDDEVEVPFDGGLSLLVAAGIGYGIKKVRDERKKKKSEGF